MGGDSRVDAARADGGEAEPIDDERDVLGDGDAAADAVVEVIAAGPDGVIAGGLLPDDERADFGERARVLEEKRVRHGRGEVIERVVALERLAVRAPLERAADTSRDVI